MSRQILSMQRIDKRFTGVHALKQVDPDLDEGEIHALVGENGAGKSTLMKVLIGINPKDSGEIHYRGHQLNPRNPKHAVEMDIGIIHQELNMMDHLTVAQNLFIGRESTRLGGLLLDRREQNRRARELFQPYRGPSSSGASSSSSRPGLLMELLLFAILAGMAYGYRLLLKSCFAGNQAKVLPLIVAFSLFFLTSIIDMMNALGLIQTLYLIEYSFLGLVLVMEYSLLKRFVAMHAQVESMNAVLEEKVRLRTGEIETPNDQLGGAAIERQEPDRAGAHHRDAGGCAGPQLRCGGQARRR